MPNLGPFENRELNIPSVKAHAKLSESGNFNKSGVMVSRIVAHCLASFPGRFFLNDVEN